MIMTDGERTVFDAIVKISRFKALIRREPSYALSNEISGHTGLKIGLISQIGDSLVGQGLIKSIKTVNCPAYELVRKPQHTDIMNEFELTIKAELDRRAADDKQLAEKYDGSEKAIQECCKYIIEQVRRSGRMGFADAEIYGMAVHFFDEGLKAPDKASSCKVVVNHAVELTEAEKVKLTEQAKKAVEVEFLKKEEQRLKDEAKAAEKPVKRTNTAKAKLQPKPQPAEDADGMLLFNFDD